jgi:uncharacterized oxidoreductase
MHAISRRLFCAVGTPEHIADRVSNILVKSNLAGHDSHGILRLPAYLESIQKGGISPAAEPEVTQRTAGFLKIDGHGGLGHHTAAFAMDQAIQEADSKKVCFVTFDRIGHIGRLGEYAEAAAAAGCIGIITVGVGNGGRAAPYGGAAGPLGTNPIAIGVPTGDETPFILDFATSIVAEGKLQVARSKGLAIPEGHILDKNGTPTTDPNDFYEGGFLLPFGEHKGSALALLTCLLSGLAGNPDTTSGVMRGAFMQVMKVGAFTPLGSYENGVRAFLDTIKALPASAEAGEVLVPGDFEHRSRIKRLAEGFDVPDPIHRQIVEWSEKLQVDTSAGIVTEADRERYRS